MNTNDGATAKHEAMTADEAREFLAALKTNWLQVAKVLSYDERIKKEHAALHALYLESERRAAVIAAMPKSSTRLAWEAHCRRRGLTP